MLLQGQALPDLKYMYFPETFTREMLLVQNQVMWKEVSNIIQFA